MAADLERLAREFKQRGFPEFGGSLRAQVKVARKLGAPEHFDNGTRPAEKPAGSEFNLEEERQRQADRYIGIGLHRELGLTEEAYLASLPKFEPQPQEYRGKFDVPLLVETRIPWQEQAQLAGIAISDYLKSNIGKTHPADQNSQTPRTPYTGWFNHWGQRFSEIVAPFDARKQLKKNECGSGPHEGIAMQITHPELNRSGKYFDLIGYRVESDDVVYLSRWDGRPELHAHWDVNAHDSFRPLVRGSKIVTG